VKERLFGTSGVRGVVNIDLTPELILRLGLALADHVNSGKVAVGFDTRLSSHSIAHSLIAGLLAGGARVQNHGLIPTPVLAYLTSVVKAKAGAMVTASHNLPEYNGVKLFDEDGMSFNHDLEQEIERLAKSPRPQYTSWNQLRPMETVNLVDQYIEMVRGSVTIQGKWRLVVDPGCGAAYSLGPRLFREQGCKVLTINAQPDGFFPGRAPEPTGESLKVLATMVKETGANAGVAYDGDADRMAVVDENGAIVPMDQLIAAYGAQLASKGRGRTIVVPVDASMCIEESVEAVGGRVVRTAVGDVNVAEAVARHKAALGAEASGAWINPDYNLCPDGILSSLLLIASVSGGQSESLSEFVKGVPRHPILRGNIACPEKLKAEAMDLLQLELPKIMREKSEILSIDGIRVSSQEAWILVRESGTEPLLRVTVEAKDYKRAELLMSEVTLLIQSIIKRLST